MSDVINQAVEILNTKMAGGIDGTAKFVLGEEGSIIVDSDGARASDDDADVTMTAEADVFQSILEGDTNPTAAFMTGKLQIDGDMGMAMKLAGSLG
jgi:putative sterol carrier protein